MPVIYDDNNRLRDSKSGPRPPKVGQNLQATDGNYYSIDEYNNLMFFNDQSTRHFFYEQPPLNIRWDTPIKLTGLTEANS